MNAPLDMHRNNLGTRWTADMDDVLRRERGGGKSFSEAIAVVNSLFGTSLTRNAAIGRASRLAIPGRPQAPPKPKPATKTVMRAVPVFRANGGISYRMKPKTVLADGPVVDRTPLALSQAAVTFFEAQRCHCRWPYGDPRDLETFRFCGEPALDDRSYCALHQRQSRGQQ